MDLSEFDYDLPPERIAQQPIEPRDAARLLVDHGPGQDPSHLTVAQLPSLVGPGDVIVVNNTRVRRARLPMQKVTGGEVEVLLLEPVGDRWEALVRPSRRVPPGTVLHLRESGLESGFEIEVGADLGEGRRSVQIRTEQPESKAIERYGQVPLPPYVHTRLQDPERYQTVYADRPASVAAPTAGLHFTPQVLQACQTAGAQVVEVELIVGLGTFRPIVTERVEDHVMHAERYLVPAATMEACRAAERVIAVGTTSVRALEAAAASGELEGRTELFIAGEYPWQMVDLLLTNFHVPRSSLLVMIDALVGPRWRSLYQEALAEGYRFLSFGDAMLLQRGGR